MLSLRELAHLFEYNYKSNILRFDECTTFNDYNFYVIWLSKCSIHPEKESIKSNFDISKQSLFYWVKEMNYRIIGKTNVRISWMCINFSFTLRYIVTFNFISSCGRDIKFYPVINFISVKRLEACQVGFLFSFMKLFISE